MYLHYTYYIGILLYQLYNFKNKCNDSPLDLKKKIFFGVVLKTVTAEGHHCNVLICKFVLVSQTCIKIILDK